MIKSALKLTHCDTLSTSAPEHLTRTLVTVHLPCLAESSSSDTPRQHLSPHLTLRSQSLRSPSAMEPPPPQPRGQPKKRQRGETASAPPPTTEATAAITAPATLCITHSACLKHYVGSKRHPEQPARVASVMSSLRELLDEQFTGSASSPFVFNLQELDSSPAMLAMLEAQLSELTQEPGSSPSKVATLQRTDSVAYLESAILPAVRAVHTRNYLEKLRTTCQHLSNRAAKPRARPQLASRGGDGAATAARNAWGIQEIQET